MTAELNDGARLTAFGEFVFDRESDELLRGDTRVILQPQPARLLGLLLSRPGRLVNQQEIAAHLWPDSVVQYEQRIRSAIRDIRIALNDDPDRPKFVETVPRRGYRFIHPLIDPQSRNGGLRRWLAIAAVTLLAGIAALYFLDRDGYDSPARTGTVVVAVLPIQNQTQADYPVDGITHELIAALAQIDPDLVRVIGRTSAMKFKDSRLPPEEIARTLGADYLLEATVVGATKTAETQLQLVATLIEPSNGSVVWASTFAGLNNDLPGFEREIVTAVAATLLPAQEHGRIATAAAAPPDAAAYAAYMKGLALIDGETANGRAESYPYFREAVSIDPGFAKAYLGIARSARAAGRPDGEVRDAIEKALEIDSNLAEGYYVRGIERFFRDWNWPDAGRDFATAVRLQPGRVEFHAFYAAYLRAAGDYAGAEREADLAMAGDPLSELVHRDNAWLLMTTGRYEQAIQLCQRGLEIRLANPERSHNCLMLSNLALGDTATAADEAREIMALGGVEPERLASLSELPSAEQFAAYWQWRLQRLSSAPPEATNYFRLAQTYVALGQSEKALSALEQGLATHQPGMVFMMGDILLAPLRDNPRFIAVARAVGIPSVLH